MQLKKRDKCRALYFHYALRAGSSERAGTHRRLSPGYDWRSGGAVPQNAGERRYPAAGGWCDRRGRENNLQVPPGDLKTKISLLFLICYVWLNQFIQLWKQFGLFVNGKKTISFEQFLTINSNLVSISDTWADLWALIFHTGLSAGRLLSIRYDDIDGDLILIRKQGHLKELRVKSTPPVDAMIARRRERYPEDVYLFQSHSNRVKYHRRPVTIIAFNAALRRAARSLPDVNVSSSSARNIPD